MHSEIGVSVKYASIGMSGKISFFKFGNWARRDFVLCWENLVFRIVQFALDLGGVHLLDDVPNALCLCSQLEKRLDRDVGPDFILQNGKLDTARPCFRLEKPCHQSGLGLTPSIFPR